MAEAAVAMNEATQSMKRAAWVSAFFVLVGTGLLYRNLRLIRQANASALKAVEVTREMAITAGRAYLHVAETMIQFRDSRFLLVVKIFNTGQTPAEWFEIESEVSIQLADSGFKLAKYKEPKPPRWQNATSGGSLGRTTFR